MLPGLRRERQGSRLFSIFWGGGLADTGPPTALLCRGPGAGHSMRPTPWEMRWLQGAPWAPPDTSRRADG